MVTTLPSLEANHGLIDALRRHGYDGPVMVAVQSDWESHGEALRDTGATGLPIPTGMPPTTQASPAPEARGDIRDAGPAEAEAPQREEPGTTRAA